MYHKPAMQKVRETCGCQPSNKGKSDTYWKSRGKLASSKFGTAHMAPRTVLQHLRLCTHKKIDNNLGRKVSGNKPGTAVTAIRSVLGHLRFCVLLNSKIFA